MKGEKKRSIHEDRPVGQPIWRVPDKGYVTPRLRADSNVNAIGFLAKLTNDDND